MSSRESVSRNEKAIYTSLNRLYKTNKNIIISWLDRIKTYDIKDGRIPHLFGNYTIEVISSSEDDVYNLMLKWFKANKDKFEGYDFTGIPDSAFISLNYKYELRSWIKRGDLLKKTLSKNPNAIDFLKENSDIIEWNYLSANPNAIELLREQIDKENKMSEDMLNNLFSYYKIDWNYLSANPNAIELLKANYKKIIWSELSSNPGAIELLKKNIKLVHWDILSSNPGAIELLNYKVEEENRMKKRELEELRTERKIDWNMLSSNPNAIEILKANHKKIEWRYLSKNPNAIELLKEYKKNIHWDVLSSNPNAIELLKEYPAKINWFYLSSNPNAIDLIKERVEYENTLNEYEYKLLENNKIDWDGLSSNPNAIELLSENSDKINWEIISSNPSIFEQIDRKTNTFNKIADVERWAITPDINPIDGTKMSFISKEYQAIYTKAYDILEEKYYYDDEYILEHLPDVHLLFENIDLVHYNCIKNKNPNYKELYNNKISELRICEFLSEYIDGIDINGTILEIEIEIIKNIFSNNIIKSTETKSNLFIIKSLFDKYNKGLINAFFSKDFMMYHAYPAIMNTIELDNINNPVYYFIKLLEYYNMNNGEKIIKYFINRLKKPNPPQWLSCALKLINDYKTLYKDIDKCFNPESGIIENYEDKQLLPIVDPLENFFEDFEKKLKKIKKPIYSQLIDFTTFKAKDVKFYLNDVEYSKFKKIKDKYDIEKKRYDEKSYKMYEESLKNDGTTTRKDSSPKPPEKPIFELSNGKKHVIGRDLDPIHIKDKALKTFNIEYQKALPVIEEYNKIKNMSYLELKKYFDNSSSPSSASKRIIKDNKLLHMTKEEIVENVLYDYSGLADKCSESIDVLTNEELDDENYPLAKLQLMVRLKVYIPGTTKYRTECIYAPKLYNYLIKCINNKEYFINPVTKSRYTEEHIEELMNVMRIIDPNIERPVFIKHRNDTMLKIKYSIIEIDDNFDESLGSIIRFYNIYLTRKIGDKEYNVYNICVIPADIEPTGTFATGSADLSSYTMLVRIFKLFNDGKLLHTYTPPYFIPIQDDGEFYYQYIKPLIHFNKYKNIDDWIYDDKFLKSKDEFIEMFKRYAEEINNYHYN